jgi:hypothetical protein
MPGKPASPIEQKKIIFSNEHSSEKKTQTFASWCSIQASRARWTRKTYWTWYAYIEHNIKHISSFYFKKN